MVWSPQPGDRVKTIVTKDHQNEIIYLNGDHAIESVITNEFLLLTGEHIPWPHQIIDYLSSKKNMNRSLVLRALIALDKTHSELSFDDLCQLFLAEEEENSSVSFFLSQ